MAIAHILLLRIYDSVFYLPDLRLLSSLQSIIAFTSDHTVDNLPYGSTKAALDRIVIASARELADRHILANVINPGPIDTGWMNGEVRRACIERQPSGRLGLPADVANLVGATNQEREDGIVPLTLFAPCTHLIDTRK